MSVRVADGVIRLEGRCRIEEAETLLGCLLEDADRRVDLSACDALHAAVVQVLMATRPKVMGDPEDPFLRAYVLPLLETDRSPSAPAAL